MKSVLRPKLVQLSVGQIFIYVGHVLFNLIGGICILMALVAALDYGFQRWDLEKRMRMTKQEIKEEFKQREGDPLIRSRIKRIQRDLRSKTNDGICEEGRCCNYKPNTSSCCSSVRTERKWQLLF